MLRIIVPMGGAGTRFAERGYTFPKPLIEIDGKPMLELVIQNLTPKEPHQFIFVCKSDHLVAFALADVITLIAPGALVVPMRQVTSGALCSVLLAANELNADDELIIANADQVVDDSIDAFVDSARSGAWDGFIMTFPSTHPRWSYAKVEDGQVVAVAEKRPISRHATVGLYYFRRAEEFLAGAERLLLKNATVGGEFYVCPVYNELILKGKRVGIREIAREQMHSLGTPEDMEQFAGSRLNAHPVR